MHVSRNSHFHFVVAEIGFNPVLYSVNEISGVVVFVVENRNADLESEVTVKLTTIEGNATGNMFNNTVITVYGDSQHLCSHNL